MDDLQAQLSSIMGNPEMMGKIMSLAQNLGLNQEAPPQMQTPEPQDPLPMGDLPDLSMIQTLSGLAGKSRIDQKQKNLLEALAPYLSRSRIEKLEKAMRAAKMAGLASHFLFPSTGR